MLSLLCSLRALTVGYLMADPLKQRKPTLLEQDRLRKDYSPLGGEGHTISVIHRGSIPLTARAVLHRLHMAMISASISRFFRGRELHAEKLRGSLSGDAEFAHSSDQREALTPLYNMGVIK